MARKALLIPTSGAGLVDFTSVLSPIFMVRRSTLFRALPVVGIGVFFVFIGYASALAPTGMGGPPNGQTGVPIEAFVDRQFDGALDPSTVNTNTVRLQANTGNTQGGAPAGANLCLSVVMNGSDRVICEHMADGPLTAETWYTVTFGMGITAQGGGSSLTSSGTYTFRTSGFAGGAGFVAPPMITGSVPRGGTRLPNNAKIRIYFDPGGEGTGSTMATQGAGSVLSPTNVKLFAAENGRPANDTNLLACQTVGSNPASPTDCNMSWSQTGSQLIITPGKRSPAGTVDSTGGSAITNGSQYVLIVEGMGGGGGNAVQNTDGISLMDNDLFVTFTATGSDSLGPDMKGTYPQNNATNVDRAMYNVTVGLTEAIDPLTVTGGSIRLYSDDGDTNFNAAADTLITNTVVAYRADSDEVILSPSALLTASTKHFLVITTNLRDISGNTFDGDRSTGGNQQEVIAFTTGTNVNGVTTRTVPRLEFANANNFSVAVTFSEPVQFDVAANRTFESSGSPFVVNNIRNWTLESPAGVAMNLAGRDIFYDPATLTATIEGVMLPPNQTFRIMAKTSTGALKIKNMSGTLMATTGSGHMAAGTVQSVMEMGPLGPGGGQGEFDFFTFGMQPIQVSPRTGLAGATSMFEVEFPADQVIPLGGTIVLTFPAGFGFVDDGGSSECEDALTTLENNDLNGPSAGTVTIASVACSSTARTVTVTTGGAATVAGDRIRFIIQGVVNSTIPKDFTTGGYTVDIKTKGTDLAVRETKTSMPFFLTTPGSQTISGTVFNDNGDGLGTANNGTKDGTEAGIANVKVCMGGMTGFSCDTTDGDGAYSFASLSNGFYHIDLPPLTSGNYVGGPFFRDIQLSGGNSQANVNFAFRSSNRTISATISGIPSNTNLDVFAFNPTNFDAGGNIVREVLWDGNATRSVDIPVTDGTWEVGVGPWMPKDPSMGPQGMPDFTFMPPKPQQLKVSGAGTYEAAFAIQSANRTIVGKVVDGSGNPVPNAFVLARPAAMTGAFAGGGVAQSKSDGTFSVRVRNGVYNIDASIPGMPPSSEQEVTVTDNTEAAADGNSQADVYSKGTLLINDYDGDGDDLMLKVSKGNRSISGRMLDESGNAISYAFVNAQEVDASGNPAGMFVGSPTDSSGNFTIYVKDGRWKVFGFAPEYGELPSITVVVDGSSVTGQNLQAETANFGTVTGTVRKGGATVGGAFVNIYGASGGNSTVTGSDGTYSLKVRSGSNYTIDGFIPGAGRLTPLTSVTVTAGATLADKDLTMSAPGTVKVTLTGSTTITDAFVEARDSNGRGNGTPANPTPGVYEVSVPAGTYTVEARNPRLGLIGQQASVSVTAGQTTTVAFTPSASYAVTGTVSSTSDTCKNGAGVMLSDTTYGRMIMATTRTDGTFTVNLSNGTYRVTAGKTGCIDSAAPSNITVNGAAVSTGADRTLTPADATVSGRVTVSGTNVTTQAKVMAESSDGRFSFADADTTMTGSTNNYTLRLTAGTWTVRARSEGSASTDATVTVTAGGSQSQNIALTAISGYTRRDPKSSTVTPARGGIVRDTNIGSNFEVNIPAGALGSDSDAASVTTRQTTAVATETPTTQMVGDYAIEISPKDANGQAISTLSSSDSAGVTITIPYTAADVAAAGTTEDKLVVSVWNEGAQQWESLATTVDAENNKLTAITTHFSTFGATAPKAAASSPGGNSPGGNSPGGNTTGGSQGGRRGAAGGAVSPPTATIQAPRSGPAEVVTADELQSVRNLLKAAVGGKDVVFKDIPVTSWFASYVATVLKAGIASGYKDAKGNLTGEFGPARSITYAEIAKMALEASGDGQAVGGFTVKNRKARAHWAKGYIRVMEDLRASVYTDRLNIDANASRGAVMQTIVEVLGITAPPAAPVTPAPATTGTGAALTGSGSAAAGSVTSVSSSSASSVTPAEEEAPAIVFSDLPAKHKHAEAIMLLVKKGIISGDTKKDGTPKGTVRPDAPVNRAEVSKIFTKLIQLKIVK